jgi:hypothetical protein
MKTMTDVRNVFSEQVEKLRKKEITPTDANAVTSTVQGWLNSIKVELAYAKATARMPKLDFLEENMGGKIEQVKK